MDDEELTGSVAEAIEQYLGFDDIVIEDERTLLLVVDEQKWRLRISRVSSEAYSGREERDDGDDD